MSDDTYYGHYYGEGGKLDLGRTEPVVTSISALTAGDVAGAARAQAALADMKRGCETRIKVMPMTEADRRGAAAAQRSFDLGQLKP